MTDTDGKHLVRVHRSTTLLPTEEIEKSSSGGTETDMERRADVIVSEIFDSELLGEGLLPSMRDAQLRLLAPGGTVIPTRAVIWGQLIQSSTLHRSTVSIPSPCPHMILDVLLPT